MGTNEAHELKKENVIDATFNRRASGNSFNPSNGFTTHSILWTFSSVMTTGSSFCHTKTNVFKEARGNN